MALSGVLRLRSPCLPVVVTHFLNGLILIGIIKTVGVFLVDIRASLQTTLTDIGVVLGLFLACAVFPGIYLNYPPPFKI